MRQFLIVLTLIISTNVFADKCSNIQQQIDNISPDEKVSTLKHYLKMYEECQNNENELMNLPSNSAPFCSAKCGLRLAWCFKDVCGKCHC